MRLLALLMLPSLTFAVPILKQPENAGIELKLSAENQLVLTMTIHNHGKEPLELPYQNKPVELLVIELHGEKGKQYKIQSTDEKAEQTKPGTLTIPAGKSKSLTVHTCHYLPELGEPGQKVTFKASLKHNGKTIESKPLTVER